ncbi:ATP-binding cassette domain-containing protein [Paenibacillus sp. JTLBN-2024]
MQLQVLATRRLPARRLLYALHGKAAQKKNIEGRREAGSAGAAEEAADALFTVDHLKKYYPVHGGGIGKAKKLIRAVDDVSFTIRKRETFGLVGESGSGKSTLGRVLLQMERATAGTVLFDGKDLTNLGGRELRAARQHMQTIFQDPYGSLDPRWKIGDSIAEPLKVHGQGSAPRPTSAAASASCWSWWGSTRRGRSGIRTSSPAGSGSGSASPARSP